MKKLKIFGLLAAVTVAGIFTYTACKKDNSDSAKAYPDAVQTGTNLSVLPGSGDQPGFRIPLGTITKPMGNSLGLTFPQGWIYVGVDAAGAMRTAGTTTVTCTCDEGSGCSPFTAGDNVGCSTSGTCTKCTMTVKNGLTVAVGGVTLTDGGVINLAGGIRPINAKAYIQNLAQVELPMAFPAMFQLPEVQQAVTAYYSKVYPNGIPAFITNNEPGIPQGYRAIAVDMFGRLAAMVVPNDYNDHTSPVVALTTVGSAKNVTCNCQQGSGCTYDSSIGVKFCKAGNCKKCSLTISLFDDIGVGMN